jgi:basic amino acid/polyamine antiporter, APA family
MALTFASYAVDGPTWVQRLAALAAVVALTTVNYHGITKTAGVAGVLLAATLVALLLAVVAIGVHAGGSVSRLSAGDAWSTGGWYGVLQSAGLIFFAFAGYARIATLGAEVRDPEHTIPRAIPLALGLTVVLYAVVATTLLTVLGPSGVAATATPMDTAASDVGAWLRWVVRIGAVTASLGALLALVAGVGRTALAMSNRQDLPRWLDAVHARHRVPHRAEVAVGAVVGVLVLTTDLRGVIGFSSFGVLLYYAVANASAFTQTDEHRRWSRGWQVGGVVGCLTLALTLPWQSVVAGAAVFGIGCAGRVVGRARREL